MIETEEQRRWWFATHPEYSWSRKGQRKTRDKQGQEKVSPEAVDAYVDEALNYVDGTVAELLKSLKRNFGTEAEENDNAPAYSDDLGTEGSESDAPSGSSSSNSSVPNGSEPEADTSDSARSSTGKVNEPAAREPGIEKLVYQRVHGNPFVIAHDRDGQPIMRFAAASGVRGIKDPSIDGKGPIPPGAYTLYPWEISKTNLLRSYLGNWGAFRVPLHPNAGTNMLGRDPKSFFLHGGDPGHSAGCINIGDNDRWLFPRLMRQKRPITILVK